MKRAATTNVKPRPARYLWLALPPLLAWAASRAVEGKETYVGTDLVALTIIRGAPWVPFTLLCVAPLSALMLAFARGRHPGRYPPWGLSPEAARRTASGPK